MATLYWYGGTGNWSDYTNHWSNNSGNSPASPASAAPTSSDDVIFDSLSHSTNYTITIDATANCKNLTMGAPSSGKVTWAGSSALNIYDSLSLSGGTSGITCTYTGSITFSSTSSGKTIDTNGITLNSDVTFNGSGGGWTLSSSLNISAKTITIALGTFNTGNYDITAGTFNGGTSGTRSITLGTSTLNLSSSSSTWSATSAGLTFSGSSSTINFTGTAFNFAANTFSYGTVTATPSSTSFFSTGNGCSISSFSVVSTTQCFLSWTSNATTTITNLTLTGPSLTARLFVNGDSGANQQSVTCSSATITNVDFRSISNIGSTWSGTSIGDFGNNSGITFTTPVTRYWVGTSGGSWEDTANWSTEDAGSGGASVPICHDTVYFTASSFSSDGRTVTSTSYKPICRTFDASAVTYTVSFVNVSYLGGQVSLNNKVTFPASWTLYASDNCTFTQNGATLSSAPLTINALNKTVTFGSDISISSISLSSGNIDSNNYNVSLTGSGIAFLQTGSAINTTFGTGTWTVSGTGAFWIAVGSINTSGSTIVLNNTSSTGKSFIGGGKTYNTVTFSGDNITVSGNNTFSNLNINTAGLTNGLKITNGSIQTTTNFSTNGYASNLAKIVSSSGGSSFSLIKTGGGIIFVDYMSIQDSSASPANTWYAGLNSSNVSGNSGWIFTEPGWPASVVENINISENIETYFQQLNFSVFDSVTAQNINTHERITTLVPNIYDSVTVAETIYRNYYASGYFYGNAKFSSTIVNILPGTTCFVVGLYTEGGSYAIDVSLDGTSMTLIGSNNGAGGTTYFYRIDNPSSGSKVLYANWGYTTINYVIVYTTFLNALTSVISGRDFSLSNTSGTGNAITGTVVPISNGSLTLMMQRTNDTSINDDGSAIKIVQHKALGIGLYYLQTPVSGTTYNLTNSHVNGSTWTAMCMEVPLDTSEPTLYVSDNITVQDSTSNWSSANDTVRVSESITICLFAISVFDNVYCRENITSAPYNLSVFDTVRASEGITNWIFIISFSDPVVCRENIQMFNDTQSISVFDPVVEREVVIQFPILSVTDGTWPGDGVAVLEDVSLLVDRFFLLNDGVKEAETFLPTRGISVSDTCNVNDKAGTAQVDSGFRYWVGGIGGTGNWNDGNNWSLISGGLGDSGNVPSPTTTVVFDANSGSGTCTINSSALCNDFDTTNYTGTIAGTSGIDIYGSFLLGSSMTYTHTGFVRYQATTTGKTITVNGKVLPNSQWLFAGVGGEWIFQENLVFSSTSMSISHTGGTINTNGKNWTIGSQIASTGNSVRSIILDNSTLTYLYTSSVTFTISGSNYSFSGTNSIINALLNSGFTFAGGDNVFGSLTTMGGLTLSGNNTFANLTLTGTSYSSLFSVSGNQIITGTLTLSGFSNAFPLKFSSSSYTVQRTISAGAVSLSNIAFQNIVADGASINWTGTRLGDMGGNENIDFDVARTLYWVGDSGSFSSASHWSLSSGGSGGELPPLVQDILIFDSGSTTTWGGTISSDMYYIGELDFTNLSNLTTFSITNAAVTCLIYGNLSFNSNVQFTSSLGFYFSHVSGNKTLKTGGAIGSNRYMSFYVNTPGVVLAGDNAQFQTCYVNSGGTFDTNDFNITFYSLLNQSNNGYLYFRTGTHTCTLPISGAIQIAMTSGTTDLGSSTINMYPTSASTVLNITGGTLIAGTSVINIYPQTASVALGISATNKTFNNVNIYSSVKLTSFTIGSSITFSNLYLSTTADKISFPFFFGLTSTITDTFTTIGYAQNARVWLCYSSYQSSASQTTITANSVSLTNTDFSAILGSGSATWTGTSLGDYGNNTGITFTSAVDRYWVGNGGIWSDPNKWSTSSGGAGGASVPLPQDTAYFDSNSFNDYGHAISIDYDRISNIDMSAVTYGPTLTLTGSLTSNSPYLGGNIILSSSLNSNSSGILYFNNYGSYSITSNSCLHKLGITNARIGNTISLADNFTQITGGGAISLQNSSIFDTNDKNLILYGTTQSASSSILYFKTGTHNFYGNVTFGAPSTIYLNSATLYLNDCNLSVSNTTAVINADSSTIQFNVASSSTRTLTLSSNTVLNNVIFNTTSTGQFTLAGTSGTITNLIIQGSGTGLTGFSVSQTYGSIVIYNPPHTLTFTSGVTSTILTSFDGVSGAGGVRNILNASSTGNFTLYKMWGTVSCDYLNITKSTATGAGWYAGLNSLDSGSNSGWVFGLPPDITITVYDSSTVSENFESYMDILSVITYDGVTVSDIWYIPPLEATSSDDSFVSEANEFFFDFYELLLSDNILVEDNPNIEPEVFERFVSIFDNIYVSEDEEEAPELVIEIYDDILASENSENGLVYYVDIYDSVTVSEDNSGLVPTILETFDSVNISEDTTAYIVVFGLVLFDSVTISDVPEFSIICRLFTNDLVLVSETFDTFSYFNYVVTLDSVRVIDDDNIFVLVEIETGDDIEVSEGFESDLPTLTDTGDDVEVSEDISFEFPTLISVYDSVESSEFNDQYATVDLSITDNILVSETVSTKIIVQFFIIDSINVSENYSIIGISNVDIIELVEVSEISTVYINTLFNVQDSIIALDNVVLLFQIFVSVSNSVLVSESLEIMRTFVNPYKMKKNPYSKKCGIYQKKKNIFTQ